MDNLEYGKLPREFRTAFEDVNGGLPFGDFVGRVWLSLAESWYHGWQLAVRHASELRPPMPMPFLPEPAPTRTFVVTVAPDALPLIHETKLPGSAQMEPMQVTTHEVVHKDLREYQVPPPPSMPAPCQAPWPGIPVTAAEAAAESVQLKELRRFIIVRASDNPSNNWRWLIQITDTELFKYGAYANADDAAKALDAMERTEQMGSIYFISDAQLRYWQQNPQLGSIPREDVE